METASILENINKASLRFQIPLTLEETYATIVEEALKLVAGDDGFIVRNFDGELKTVYGSSAATAAYKVRPKGNTYKAITQQKAILIDYDDIKKISAKKTSRIHSVLFIPLSYKEYSEGVLVVRSLKEKQFTQRQISILQLFGSFASLAIKKNELYDETKNALEVRDLFISLASHELRTPLTSINGYIQLLNSKMGKMDTPEAGWVRELYGESKRLTNLIQELLEINRIKQGQLHFVLRESHFSEIVKHAIERCKLSYSDRNIVFKNSLSEEEDIVIGDFDKLLHVVAALLGNALKFSPDETVVTISLSSKGKQIILRVSDRGSGIAREDMAKIFDGFYKASESHREGMGVGLLLAKHIINYHKGSIAVTSELKKGTTVEVSLPKHSYDR